MRHEENLTDTKVCGKNEKTTIPELMDWQFLFYRQHGSRNLTNAMKTFAKIVAKPGVEELPMTGLCQIGGKVYGHPSFPDGQTIVTSYIKKISTLDESETRSYHQKRAGVKPIFIQVETNEGGIYCIDYHKANFFMDAMIYEFVTLGKLLDYDERHSALEYSGYGFF